MRNELLRRGVSVALGIGATLGLGAGPSCATPPGPTPSEGVSLDECELAAPGISRRQKAECGSIEVDEDRSEDGGRHIVVEFAVLRAIDRAPEPDPLFILSGGPGQSARELIVGLEPAFRMIRRNRDLVVVDQRGTGGSNPLRCPSSPLDELRSLSEARILERVDACLQSLDSDPTRYSSVAAAEDLEAVRESLGYGEVNIYGISYGTRLAMVYASEFGSNVRSMILDGVVPKEVAVGEHAPAHAKRSLDWIFDRCAKERTCRDAFGETGERFETLMARLSEPVAVELDHPRTHEPVTVTLDRHTASVALHRLSYGAETAALIPLLISEASRSRYEPLAAQFVMASEATQRSVADALNLSIVCSEDVPFYENISSSEGYMEEAIAELALVCEHWPRFEVSDDWKQPFETSIPVLLLSGEADPITPPTDAERVHARLSQSRHLVVEGLGHGVFWHGCIPNLGARFLSDASFDDLDEECLEKIAPPRLFSSYSGPSP